MEENMYENKILDAIQMLVDNAIDKATFDKTIRGVISKCVDEKNGKYIVIYQDSSFYAYSTDTNQTYSAGTPVYVLVPRNDMTQTKTIIGSVNKLGSDYINTIENSDRYEAIGNSVATLNSEQGICSYKNNGDILVLYDKNAVSSIVDIDTIAATTYIKQAKYLTLGGEFRTALAKEQRYKGNYGLGFDINFTDNMTNETVKRTYLVDVNNMLGNPYEYTKPSNQKIVFDIDGANFVDIDKIYLFCYDFPVTTVETKPDDIFVVNLTLEAAAALTDDELAGNKLTLITPQGIYFSNNDSITSSRKIDTEVKIDNKVVNKDSSLLKYFWFKENYSINTSSLLYNRYGGNGWECLNEYNIVETDGNNNPTIIDWITNQSSYLIRKSNTIARETDYKCVVSYNNEIVLTKKFTVYNYSSNYVVTIDSDSGTYFSYDNGRPTLTCSVNQTGNYEYVWGMMNGGGAFTPIQETTTTNTAYHTAANKYAELEAGLRNGTIVLTAAIQQEFTNLKYTLEQYNNDIMRVEDNVIYNLKLNMITNFATFVCSVYNNGAYIGKGSIKIENDLNTSDNSYTLIINNGDQVFKYNGDGISPTSRSLDKPQELYPLSFTLYDEKGNEISNDVINADKVYWTVPTSDTMIKVSAVHGNPSEVDEYAETATYTGYKSFNFEIPVLYTANKTRNTIQLKVKYKNKIIVANTELMFLKEGESGSNGTDFICRIVPNTIDGAISPLYPIVTWNNNAAAGATNPTINFTPRTSGVWFKAQLYHNGSEIFDSPISGPTTEDKNVTIKWEMMKNKYDTTHLDVSNFSVNSSTGVFSYDNLSSVSNTTLKDNPVNIVKCTLTYDGIDYVATMPIILVKVNNSGSAQYKVELVENTGFRYAMYTTDGRTPIYDNSNPFALKVIQTVENTDQDISTNTLTDYAVDYNWSVKGLIYTNDWETQSNLILDTLRSRNLQRNEKYYKPVDDFNGLCLSNALFCDIKRNNVTLATIHLPIHMYLNRYGNAAMNSWDGNSIAIDNDGGFILAPQVGAGKKEQDNSFTGVFMGSVKEAGSSEEEVGLFGYNSGTRTLELNSKDGSAKFGKVGKGQIIIEPGEDKAVIQSGDYEMILSQASGKYIAGNVYFRLTNGIYTELKEGTDYHNGDNITGGNIYVWTDGSGMEIDLNDPHIRFGSGKFRIDSDGNVYAEGYATIADLESGDINIPGTENWKIETTADYVQIPTDTNMYPIDTTVTKTITGKCLYKDSYVSGYTIQLVDSDGNPITHNPNSDGIEINSSISGQNFTISFSGSSSRQIVNAVNNYYFKFSYVPIGGNTQTITKLFSVNIIIMAEDGRSITSAIVKYQGGTSATTPPDNESGWVVDPPVVAQGEYLWTRTIITYSSGDPTTTYSVSYMGVNGQDGQSGTSYYTYIRYSINSDGNPMVDTPTDSTKYIGIYSGTSATIPSYTAFTWSKYVGNNGSDGKGILSTVIQYQGSSSGTTPPTSESGWVDSPPTVTKGNYLWTRVKIAYTDNTTSTSYSVSYIATDGINGTSYYTYIRYSENSSGNPMVTTPTNTTKYIGVYSGTSSSVPTYTSFTWSKYVGDNGRGISSIVNYYLAYASNTGVTTSTSGWTTQVQTTTSSKPYLWNYETINYDNNTSANTTPAVIGMYSEDGVDGRGIASITEYYAINNNPNSEPADSSFDTTVVSPIANNRYLWNYELITYDDNSTPYKSAKRIIGTYGNGIGSTTISYASSTQGTNPSLVTGWQTGTIPSVSAGNYLWTRAIVTYNDNTTSTTYSVALMGQTGPQGQQGPPGADGTSVTIKGSYATLNDLITAHPSGNTLGDGYIVDLDLYIFTDSAGGGGSSAGDWEDVGQFKGFDAKICFITATTEIFKSTDGGTTFTPSTTTITPTFQAVNYQDWAYSVDSGNNWTTLTGSETGININSTTHALTITASTFTPFSSSSIITFRCRSNGQDDNGNPIEDTISIVKIVDGIDGTGVWTTTVAPTTPNYTFTISNLTGMNRIPIIGDIIVYDYYRYTITSVSTTTVLAGTRTSIRGANGRGISSSSVTYQASSSGTVTPTGTWSSSVPSVTAGQYLWTKTVLTYTDNTNTTSYAVAYRGTNGTSVNITSQEVTYAQGDSGTTAPTSGWQSTIPSVPDGKYLWTKTYVLYSDSNSTISYSVSYQSKDGVNGTNGINGTNGTDGVSATNVVCGNEAQAIPCGSNGNTSAASSITIPFAGYLGATRIACSVSYSTLPSGMSLVSNTAATASADGSLVLAVDSGASLGGSNSGTITLTFSCNSQTFVKTFSWAKAIAGTNGTNGTSPYNVILTNESQTIAGTTSAAIATTITTNVIGYMGTTQMVTTVGTISGLPTGMTAAITNNNTTSPLITFTITTSMITKSGQVTIPVTINGITINKIFSYSLSLTGATGQTGSAGAAAKAVIVNPSSQIFKSTTGASGTFTPQYIYLYPSFQSVTYSKWQYSTDGTTWINVTSGSNNLTIGTYNSIANSLRIERTCNLYTDSITAISFRCVSNDANIYDTVTIVKIYDVVDLSVGGRNLLIKTSNPKIATGTGGTNQTTVLYNFSSFYMDNYYDLTTVAGKSVKVTFSGDWETTATSGTIGVQLGGWPYTGFVSTITVSGSNQSGHLKGTATIAKNASYNTSYNAIMTRLDNLTGTVTFSNVKIELGDVATDWTIAPEDLATNQVLQYITTSTSTAPSSSAAGWGPSIPVSADNYVWQRLQTIYDNGTTENSTPVCIYTPSIQISSIEEQYFIHTSNTTAPSQSSTSWLNEKPEWQDSYYQAETRRYLWVRTKYTYTGNTSKIEYSIPYYDPTWETISLLNQSIIDNAQAVEDAINNGYVTIKDGYIEIRDTADSSKGILLSKEGISFKINGNTYTSVWSLDGTFNAQSILVKNLNASNILSGTLTLKAADDATNGVFLLQNTNGNEVAKVDVNGLKVTAIDGSYVYLRTGEDNSSYKGIYLVDAGGNTFVSTNTTNGIFTVEKQVINDYQEFNGNIRIIRIGNRGIGFIGI